MPSQAMQELIDAFRDRQRDGAGQGTPSLEERRATFTEVDPERRVSARS